MIDLDDGNEVRGLNIDPQGTGGGIAGGTGDASGTIDDVNITDTGTAGTQPGLELDGTTGTFTVSNLTVSTNGATGVRLNNAGTVSFAPDRQRSRSRPAAPPAWSPSDGATGTNLGTSTFDAITVTGSSTGGVSMTNTTGTTTFGDLALTTTSGATAAFALSNAGTVSVPAAGTANVSATGGPAVDVTGTTGATLAFDAVSSTNSTTDGINLAGLGTGTFTAASGTITGAAGIAFDLDGGSGAITYPGALNNGAGQTAEITGRSGGTVTLSGPITETSDADATRDGGIAVTGNTGGSTVVSNATKTLQHGRGPRHRHGHERRPHADALGRRARHRHYERRRHRRADQRHADRQRHRQQRHHDDRHGGQRRQHGHRRAPRSSRISANGAANGIILNNTGSAAGLTVTGGGSTAQGGDNSGGTIQSTTGHGISLTNTTEPVVPEHASAEHRQQRRQRDSGERVQLHRRHDHRRRRRVATRTASRSTTASPLRRTSPVRSRSPTT